MLQVPENKDLPLQTEEDLFEVTESEFMVTLLCCLTVVLVSEEVQSDSPRVGALWVGSMIFGWHFMWTTKFNLVNGVSVRWRGLVGHGKAEVSARKNLKDQVGKWCDWEVCCWRWDKSPRRGDGLRWFEDHGRWQLSFAPRKKSKPEDHLQASAHSVSALKTPPSPKHTELPTCTHLALTSHTS